ncbi:hypothetical protein MAA_11420 [Metarhizium robertsii ARSEF 23]|uniref:Uncharacterized protein n=1 Tax=Metarhizium robertsii (strain ARSEF 23 / ATCC MYA-3075) TaxID=655844 RepID=A0A0B2X7I5_METRA|nr:uncharacterized protein MAA_11420 [Metarhizium robertsii ARSEF 23]KHO10883.1 hypothetical protein MAA_11420 [Metarhizium robertsii ARSEF 23]
MEVGKILKLLFWGFALVHLVGSVWICITASHLNTKENKERGIFVYKLDPIHQRRDLTNPIGSIGDGVTKVVSVATQAVGAASTVIGAVETKAADLRSKLKIELDVGTENVTLQVGDNSYQPLRSGGDLNLPNLPGNLSKTIEGIKKKFEEAASVGLEVLVNIAIGLSFISTGAYLAVAAISHFHSGHPRGTFICTLALVAGFGSNGIACVVFLGLHLILGGIASLGSKLPSVDAGDADDDASQSFHLSVVQCVVSLLLFLLSILHKCCLGCQDYPHKTESVEGKKLPSEPGGKAPYAYNDAPGDYRRKVLSHNDKQYDEKMPSAPVASWFRGETPGPQKRTT